MDLLDQVVTLATSVVMLITAMVKLIAFAAKQRRKEKDEDQ